VLYLLCTEKRDSWNLSLTDEISEYIGISVQDDSDYSCCICSKDVEEEEDT
jgi:hypothetical protein